MADNAPTIGKAYVQIIPSARGIKNELANTLESPVAEAGKTSGKGFAKNFAKALGGAGIATAAAALGKVIKDSVSRGAALEQSIGGVETLFKDAADDLIANANRAYKTAGVSANSYMEQATSFAAALVNSLGGDTKRAAEIADMAIIDMADNANKMGTSIDSIQTAYQSMARGQYQLLDNLKLGYGGTRAEMERLLEDAEKFSGVHYDISNLSDVYEAIHVIQTELGITGTTAEEAEKTVSGSFAQMKAAYDNLLGQMALGEDIKPALEELGETVGTFLGDNLIPMVLTAASGLGKGLKDWFFDDALPGIGEWFSSLLGKVNEWGAEQREKLFEPFTNAWDDVTGWFSDLKKKFDVKLKFQGIELPHINVSYKTTGTMAEIAKKLGMKGVPQFSVDWYAKGGIFDSPSIIGVGEKGDEAVLPLDTFWQKLDAVGEKLTRKIDDMKGKKPGINITVISTLDGREIARSSAAYLNDELEIIRAGEERGLW